MQRSHGLPYISTSDARVLILGSMPSARSLQESQYYAHARNAFWPIMGELFGAGCDKPYGERIQILKDHGVAVWDVMNSCIRPGSMDADIRDEEPNDFGTFFMLHSRIKRIGLNGQKAAAAFACLNVTPPSVISVTLPSTSPANARLNLDRKCEAWRKLLLC